MHNIPRIFVQKAILVERLILKNSVGNISSADFGRTEKGFMR